MRSNQATASYPRPRTSNAPCSCCGSCCAAAPPACRPRARRRGCGCGSCCACCASAPAPCCGCGCGGCASAPPHGACRGSCCGASLCWRCGCGCDASPYGCPCRAWGLSPLGPPPAAARLMLRQWWARSQQQPSQRRAPAALGPPLLLQGAAELPLLLALQLSADGLRRGAQGPGEGVMQKAGAVDAGADFSRGSCCLRIRRLAHQPA